MLESMDQPAQPIACRLDGADLADRIEAWREVVQRATSRGVEGDCVVAVYPNDAQLLDRLRELIAAEAECCSFLRFSLEATPDAILTELRLPEELPESMRTRVVALFG
jgi:hypothetical protein